MARFQFRSWCGEHLGEFEGPFVELLAFAEELTRAERARVTVIDRQTREARDVHPSGGWSGPWSAVDYTAEDAERDAMDAREDRR